MNASLSTYLAGHFYASKNEPSADYALLYDLRAAALADYAAGHSKEWNRGQSDSYKSRMAEMVSRGLDAEEKQTARDIAEESLRFSAAA